MKYILKEITPLGGNDLFIANHWPDNQMDFPLHFHEDYELNLTLHVRGKRTVGNLVEDFTEKDLVITNPNVLHCYKRGESYANVRCEVVVVQFSKNLPSWGIFDTDQLRPIREMLCQPAPGIRFSEDTADRVRDRLLRLPHLEGFEAVLLFLDILHELACADRTKVEADRASGRRLLRPQPPHQQDRAVRGAELQPEDFARRNRPSGRNAGVVREPFFQKTHAAQLLGLPQRIPDQPRGANDHRDRTHDFGDQLRMRLQQHLNFNRVFRERIGTTPSDYRRKFKASVIPRVTGRKGLGTPQPFPAGEVLFPEPQLPDRLLDPHAVGNPVALRDGAAEERGTARRRRHDPCAGHFEMAVRIVFAQPAVGIAQPGPAGIGFLQVEPGDFVIAPNVMVRQIGLARMVAHAEIVELDQIGQGRRTASRSASRIRGFCRKPRRYAPPRARTPSAFREPP